MLAVAATATDKVVMLWQQPSVTTPATIYYSLNANNTTYYNIANNGSGDYNNLSLRQASVGFAVGNTGALAISRDQGLNWTTITSGTQNNLFAIDSPDGNVAYLVGSNGTVRKATGPNFTSWQAQNSATTARLTSVWFVDAQQGYLVGESGTALRTTNGGATWTSMPVNTAADLNAIRFINASIGFIAGDLGTLLITTNGGVTWQPEASNTFETLNGISATPTGSSIWVAGGGGTVLKRTAVTPLASQTAAVDSPWRVYPNPFTTSIRIELANSLETTAQLLDMTGRVVVQQSFSSVVSPTTYLLSVPAQLPVGLYILQLITNGQVTQTQKVMHLSN